MYTFSKLSLISLLLLSVFGADMPARHPAGSDNSAYGLLHRDQAIAELNALHPVSITILQDGNMIKHVAFADGGDVKNESMSITKSVTALIAGMAIHAGLLGSLDDPISKRFAGLVQAPYAKVTLRQILQQDSCFELPNSMSPREVDDAMAADLFAALDRVTPSCLQYKTFFYSNLMPNVVSLLVEYATGRPMAEFAGKNLFKPLGIKNWFWDSDKKGHTKAQAGLSLSSIDMAKIGQLLLQNGQWENKQIIPKNFMIQLHTKSPNNPKYSLLWWLTDLSFQKQSGEEETNLFGHGYAGQYLYVDQKRQRVTSILTRPQWAWFQWDDSQPEKSWENYLNAIDDELLIVKKIISSE